MTSRYMRAKAEKELKRWCAEEWGSAPPPDTIKLFRVARFYRRQAWTKRAVRDNYTLTTAGLRSVFEAARKYGVGHDIVKIKREWRIVWPNQAVPRHLDYYTVDNLLLAQTYIESIKFHYAKAIMTRGTLAAVL